MKIRCVGMLLNEAGLNIVVQSTVIFLRIIQQFFIKNLQKTSRGEPARCASHAEGRYIQSTSGPIATHAPNHFPG